MIFGAINKLATLRNLARTVVVVLMVLCAPFPLSADHPSEGYTQANEAYLKGEYPKAIALLRPLVEKGEAGPQSLLGLIYMNGQGVPADYARAKELYRASAAQGNREGQFGPGYLYATGKGVHKSLTDAIRWLEPSANQGSKAAQYTLATIYSGGADEVGPDLVRAYKWYTILKSIDKRYDAGFTERLETRMNAKQIEEARKQALKSFVEFEASEKM